MLEINIEVTQEPAHLYLKETMYLFIASYTYSRRTSVYKNVNAIIDMHLYLSA